MINLKNLIKTPTSVKQTQNQKLNAQKGKGLNAFTTSNRGQTQTFNQLFLKSTESTNQLTLPKKMSFENLVNLVSENKLEVFINHDNKMVNVTNFFKANQDIAKFTFYNLQFTNTNVQTVKEKSPIMDYILQITSDLPLSEELNLNTKSEVKNDNVNENKPKTKERQKKNVEAIPDIQISSLESGGDVSGKSQITNLKSQISDDTQSVGNGFIRSVKAETPSVGNGFIRSAKAETPSVGNGFIRSAKAETPSVGNGFIRSAKNDINRNETPPPSPPHSASYIGGANATSVGNGFIRSEKNDNPTSNVSNSFDRIHSVVKQPTNLSPKISEHTETNSQIVKIKSVPLTSIKSQSEMTSNFTSFRGGNMEGVSKNTVGNGFIRSAKNDTNRNDVTPTIKIASREVSSERPRNDGVVTKNSVGNGFIRSEKVETSSVGNAFIRSAKNGSVSEIASGGVSSERPRIEGIITKNSVGNGFIRSAKNGSVSEIASRGVSSERPRNDGVVTKNSVGNGFIRSAKNGSVSEIASGEVSSERPRNDGVVTKNHVGNAFIRSAINDNSTSNVSNSFDRIQPNENSFDRIHSVKEQPNNPSPKIKVDIESNSQIVKMKSTPLANTKIQSEMTGYSTPFRGGTTVRVATPNSTPPFPPRSASYTGEASPTSENISDFGKTITKDSAKVSKSTIENHEQKTDKRENIVDNKGFSAVGQSEKQPLAQSLHTNKENTKIKGDEMANSKTQLNENRASLPKAEVMQTVAKPTTDVVSKDSYQNTATQILVSEATPTATSLPDINVFSHTAEELFKTHINESKPFIVNFISENGETVSQQVIVDNSMDTFMQSEETSHSDIATERLPRGDFHRMNLVMTDNRHRNDASGTIDFQSVIETNFERLSARQEHPILNQTTLVKDNIERKSELGTTKSQSELGTTKSDNSNSDSNNNQNNQSFQDFQNSFAQNSSQVSHSSLSRGSSAVFDLFNQHIISKAQEFSKTQQYEVKSVFDVNTLNFGKINVQIEKQGSILRIDLKVETKEKESSIKENVQELAAQLKQFGFEQIDINIDLDSGSNDNSHSGQESNDSRDTSRQSENNNEHIQESIEKERNFGYNSFEYTA